MAIITHGTPALEGLEGHVGGDGGGSGDPDDGQGDGLGMEMTMVKLLVL